MKIICKEGVAMAIGIVKWFDEKKGYGNIEQEDGPDVSSIIPESMQSDSRP